MPSTRYAEIAPQVRDICERYGLPYNTRPVPHSSWGWCSGRSCGSPSRWQAAAEAGAVPRSALSRQGGARRAGSETARLGSSARAGKWPVRARQEFDPVTPRVGGEESPHAADPLIPIHRRAGLGQARGQRVESLTIHSQCRVPLAGGYELPLDADVDLSAAEREPGAAVGSQPRWLLDLRQLEQPPIELARRGFATGRGGELDMVECDLTASSSVLAPIRFRADADRN